MDIASLPPKPDIHTGQPRPPRAPLEPGRTKPGKRHEAARRRISAPPAGEGPMLEWNYPDRAGRILAGLAITFLGIIVYTLKDWGFSWTSNPWLWVLLTPWPFVFLLYGRTSKLSAGADWMQWNKQFIKTYELTAVKVDIGGSYAPILDMDDQNGNGTRLRIGELQQNFELWDLVYNGILHSVHVGKAETNQRARDYLQLDFPPHLSQVR